MVVIVIVIVIVVFVVVVVVVVAITIGIYIATMLKHPMLQQHLFPLASEMPGEQTSRSTPQCRGIRQTIKLRCRGSQPAHPVRCRGYQQTKVRSSCVAEAGHGTMAPKRAFKVVHEGTATIQKYKHSRPRTARGYRSYVFPLCLLWDLFFWGRSRCYFATE